MAPREKERERVKNRFCQLAHTFMKKSCVIIKIINNNINFHTQSHVIIIMVRVGRGWFWMGGGIKIGKIIDK